MSIYNILIELVVIYLFFNMLSSSEVYAQSQNLNGMDTTRITRSNYKRGYLLLTNLDTSHQNIAHKRGITVKKTKEPTTGDRAAQRWSITLTPLGFISTGPAENIEQAMLRDGWDDPSYSIFFSSKKGKKIKHPYSRGVFSNGTGAAFSLQVSYSINREFDGIIMISKSIMGQTFGYKSSGPMSSLCLNFYSTVISTIMVFKASDLLQFGVGPAWFINTIERESSLIGIIYRERKGRMGFLLSASFIFPSKTIFFFKLDTQYRWTPKETYGPFKDTYQRNSLNQLNLFKADFSHVYLGFGLGVRL